MLIRKRHFSVVCHRLSATLERLNIIILSILLQIYIYNCYITAVQIYCNIIVMAVCKNLCMLAEAMYSVILFRHAVCRRTLFGIEGVYP